MYLKQSQKNRRGFTLTEAAIVLGIMGLILGAIWVAAASVYQNLRISRTSQQMLQIVQSIRSMYATSQTMGTTADVTESLITAGIFPSDVVRNSTTVINSWDGNINVQGYTNSVAGDSFAISFSGVPQSACIDFVLRNSGQGRDAGLIGVNTAPAKDTFADPQDILTLQDATAACEGANGVFFTFKLKG